MNNTTNSGNRMIPTVTALVIPVEGPLETVELTGTATLEKLVGGYIEELPMPAFLTEKGTIDPACEGAVTIGTVIINGEGEGILPFNQRATDFMVPGVGLDDGDYIAGPAVLVGLGEEGETISVQDEAAKRARLIKREVV